MNKKTYTGSKIQNHFTAWDDYGRPSVMKQETFDENFQSVVSGETTPTQLRKNLGMTHSTFYRYRKTFYEKYPELSNSAN